MNQPENNSQTPKELEPTLKFDIRNWKDSDSRDAVWQKTRITAIASHPAGANALAAILNHFDSRQNLPPSRQLITCLGGSDAMERFTFSSPPQMEISQPITPAAIFDRQQTNVLLFSATLGQEMEQVEIPFILEALRRNICVIGVEDDTPGLFSILQLLSSSADINFINGLLLANTTSKDFYQRHFPNLNPEKLITTGQPAYDAVRAENTAGLNSDIRNALKIPGDAFVIAHIASRSWGFNYLEEAITEDVGRAISRVAVRNPNHRFVFLHCQHPAELRDSKGDPQRLTAKLPQPTDNLLIINYQSADRLVAESGIFPRKLSGLEYTAVANAATSAFSTTLVPVALRGARTDSTAFLSAMPIYYWTERAKHVYTGPKAEGGLGYPEPVPLQLGAASTAHDVTTLAGIIEKLLHNKTSLQAINDRQQTTLRAAYRFRGKVPVPERAVLNIRAIVKSRNKI